MYPIKTRPSAVRAGKSAPPAGANTLTADGSPVIDALNSANGPPSRSEANTIRPPSAVQSGVVLRPREEIGGIASDRFECRTTISDRPSRRRRSTARRVPSGDHRGIAKTSPSSPRRATIGRPAVRIGRPTANSFVASRTSNSRPAGRVRITASRVPSGERSGSRRRASRVSRRTDRRTRSSAYRSLDRPAPRTSSS